MKNRIAASLMMIWCLASVCHADDLFVAAPSQEEAIDIELKLLKEEEHRLRLKVMQEEIGSQRLMFEKWGEYAEHIREAETYEEKANQLQERIDLLEKKRRQLLLHEESPEN